MPTKQESLKRIIKRIAEFKYEVDMEGRLGWTDIHKHAERLFCRPLSMVLGGEVTVLEYEQKNYPAIDLYCESESEKTGIQITSTNTHPKIQHTLDETRKHLSSREVTRVMVLIIGDKKKFHDRFTPPDWLDFSLKDDVWDIPDLLLQIERKCTDRQLYDLADYLDFQNQDRAAVALASIQETIEQITRAFEELKSAANSPTLHLHLPFEKSKFLHGKMLGLLMERLKQNKAVFITGPKGSGKKTLAVKLGYRYRDGKVHYAKFHRSFSDTITQELSRGLLIDYDISRMQESELCHQVLARLQDNDLLIITDAVLGDGPVSDDSGFYALCKCPIKLVVTTEQNVSGTGVDAIRMMPPEQAEDLLALMPAESKNTARLLDLIQESDNHPGMVRLLAKALASRTLDIRSAELLNALRGGTLHEGKTAALYKQFSAMAPVCSLTEREKTVFRCLLLAQERMTEDLFRIGLDSDEQLALDRLKRSGRLVVDARNCLRFASPVIRLVSRTELPPSYDSCRNFLSRLKAEAEMRCSCHNDCVQIADCFEMAMGLFCDPVPLQLRMHAVTIARLAGRDDKAREYESPILRLQNIEPKNRTYQDCFYIALNYLQQKDIPSARDAMQVALKHADVIDPIKGLPPIPDYDLALIHHNLAVLCEKDNDLKEAEKNYEKALLYFPEGLEKANTCIQLSQLFWSKEDAAPEYRKQALPYARDAIICAGRDPIALERAYANSARAHLICHSYIQAREDALEALKYRQKHIPPGSPPLLESLRLVMAACLKAAAFCANLACTENTHPDVIKNHFHDARQYAAEALTYADAAMDNTGRQNAYTTMIYACHQAARGELRRGAFSQAEAYLQEARSEFQKVPEAYQAGLTKLAQNLAALYQTAMLADTDQTNPAAALNAWVSIWEFCIAFKCLRSYACTTVYPQIVKSADQYGQLLRANTHANRKLLLNLYKQMSDFFTANADEEQRRKYLQLMLELDRFVSDGQL